MTKKNNGNSRLKVTTACQNCQRRKIKCSGEIPCTYCLKVERPCEPGKPGKKRGPPPGQEVIRSRSSRMETVYYSAIKDPQLKEQLRLYDVTPDTSTELSPIVEPQNDSDVTVSSDAGLSNTTTSTSPIHNVDSSNPIEVPSNPDEDSSDSADVPNEPINIIVISDSSDSSCSTMKGSSSPSDSSFDTVEVSVVPEVFTIPDDAIIPVKVSSIPEIPDIPVEVSLLPDDVSSNPVEVPSITVKVSSNPVEVSSEPAVEVFSNTVKGTSNPVEGSSNPVAVSSNPVEISPIPFKISTDPVKVSSNPPKSSSTSFRPTKASGSSKYSSKSRTKSYSRPIISYIPLSSKPIAFKSVAMTPVAMPYKPAGMPYDTSGNFYNPTIYPTGTSSSPSGSSSNKPTGISFDPSGISFGPAGISSEIATVTPELTRISSSSHNGNLSNPNEVSYSTVDSGLPFSIDKVSSNSGSSGNIENTEVESEIQKLAKGKLPEELELASLMACLREGEGQNTDKIQANNDLLLNLRDSKDSIDKVSVTRRHNKLRKIQPKPPQSIINNRERWNMKVPAQQAMKDSEQRATTEQQATKVTEQLVNDRQPQPENLVQDSENNEENKDNDHVPAMQELGAYEDNPPSSKHSLPFVTCLSNSRQELFENMQLSQIRDSRDTVPSHYATNKTNENLSTVWTKIPRTTTSLPSKSSLQSQVGTATRLPQSSFSKSSTESSGRMFTSSSTLTSMSMKPTEQNLQRGSITLPPLVPTVSYPDYSKPAKVSSELPFSKSDQVIPPLQPGLNVSWNRSIIPSMQTNVKVSSDKPKEPADGTFIKSVKQNERVDVTGVTLCTEKDDIIHDLTEQSQGSSSKSAQSESEKDTDELMNDTPEKVSSIKNRKKRRREHKGELSSSSYTRPINDRRRYQKPTRRITRNAAREALNTLPNDKKKYVRRR
ncbi:1887_t:CDS:2 [Funneliformis mosseae]|uniref:1887_t:CDS:1 n=1 Tax=Funneliformis mosseae TaxID=27381 RepID=A0A9N8ZIC3_FUNMO|nr:1887_t:CDS:2 [Funneliformis mosseae]